MLEQGHDFCEEHGLGFSSATLHELLAHSDAAKILPLVTALDPDAYEPLATTGVPLAIREDWEDLLAAILSIGTKTWWFTFHSNLRKNGVEAVFQRALERGPVSADEMYFNTREIPTAQELAVEAGDINGTRIYFSAVEMRQRWLDAALVECRRY